MARRHNKRARQFRKFGSSPTEHYKALIVAQNNVVNDVNQARKNLNKGNCREAFDDLLDIERSLGMFREHNESGGGRGRHSMDVATVRDQLTIDAGRVYARFFSTCKVMLK